jgi:hypothetical protein
MRAKPFSSILVAVFPLLALSACSSSDDPMGGGSGQVQFVLAAAPAPLSAATADDDDRPPLQAANVTFTSFQAGTLDGQLVSITGALPFTVDLLQVVNGGEVSLPTGFLPPGTYDQLVVVMSQVELVGQDGGKIAITPPGGGWTAIVNVGEPFVVTEGQTTTIRLRFRWWSAFHHDDDGFEFNPEFDCEHD